MDPGPRIQGRTPSARPRIQSQTQVFRESVFSSREATITTPSSTITGPASSPAGLTSANRELSSLLTAPLRKNLAVSLPVVLPTSPVPRQPKSLTTLTDPSDSAVLRFGVGDLDEQNTMSGGSALLEALSKVTNYSFLMGKRSRRPPDPPPIS